MRAGCLFLLLAAAGLVEARPPNLVLILADDLGVEGLGCYGGLSYRTPALDQLAARGMRFTHAYAQPLCTNTRVQLMTGKFNSRNWLAFGLLDPKEKTIGHYLRDAGYKTCIAGKWQLQSYDPPDYPGAEKRRDKGMHPEDAGFDEYCLWHTGHTELKGSRFRSPVIKQNGSFRNDLKDRYGPAVWVEYINDFMKRHRDEPFFVYYPMALPHRPFEPSPDSPAWNEALEAEDPVHFTSMVEYMDKAVGQVVDQVDALGLREETLILFYSDNGTHKAIRSRTAGGDVQGAKGMTTDAGTHVPMIANWKGRIKAGQINDDLVDSTDFIPTLLEAAGKAAIAGLDGRSFFPRLLGNAGNPRAWIYCFYDPRPGWDKDPFSRQVFIRDQRFKHYEDGRLFDLPADPLEQRPILPAQDSPESAEARERLAAALAAIRP